MCDCVFVQFGQLSPYPPVDSIVFIYLQVAVWIWNCIMLVIKSTHLFDFLSLCESENIFYYVSFTLVFFTTSCAVGTYCSRYILNYNTTLLQLVLLGCLSERYNSDSGWSDLDFLVPGVLGSCRCSQSQNKMTTIITEYWWF